MITSSKLLPVHKRFDLSFDYGKGVYLFSGKKKYLDFGAGIAVNVLGHCHEAMIEAINTQSRKLWHVSNIYNSKELNSYAEKLVAATNFADFTFFCNSGAESVECAIKMIRRHFFVKKQPHRNRIITFTGAFHGRTIATISAAAKKKYLEGFEPALAGFDNVEFGSEKAVLAAITENTAGILIEPIQGEEGIRVASHEFIRFLRRICDEKQILLALDEVQCGMGRTGELFAADYFSIKPDIVCIAKAIAGGFPLGACLASGNAACGMSIGVHGTTYGGNPMAMAIADSVFEIISKPEFLDNVKKIGDELKNGLILIKSEFPDIIDEVRGVGLMLGIKINQKIENGLVVKSFIENELLTIPAGENVIRILPSLIINSDHVNEGLTKIRESFKEVVKN